ncbi:hypothetical protein JCM8097_002013 [Rhodosporidiobolus ruineniae]
MDRLDALAAFALAHPLKAASYSILLYVLSRLIRTLYRLLFAARFSSLRDVPGPPAENAWWGNVRQVISEECGVAHHQWTEKYGGAVRYKHLLGEEQLLLTDPVALNHVLSTNVDNYPKPPDMLASFGVFLGRSHVAGVHGDFHRRQRRLMAPAFLHGPIKAWVPMFFDLSYQLRDQLRGRIEAGETDLTAWPSRAAAIDYVKQREKDETVFESLEWVTKLTLDALGKGALGYEFNAMSGERNALAEAFHTVFLARGAPTDPAPANVLVAETALKVISSLHYRGWLKYIPTAPTKFLHEHITIIDKESRKIIESKIEKEEEEPEAKKRDLLSIFHTPAARDALTPDELRAQLKLFIFAGHEGVTIAVCGALHWLSLYPEKQSRLRREIRAARRKAVAEGREELTADEVYNLPYLDAVMREAVRFEGNIASLPRIAAQDDLIPLSQPIRSVRDPFKTLSHIPVRKGQHIEISVYSANRSKAIYGEDAEEFRPERWLDPEKKIEGGVGVWSGIMSFLHGQRACIGYRFALYQMKACLSVLLDDFEFEPRDPDCRIEHRLQLSSRPFVVGERHHGSKLPLKIRIARQNEAEEGE